MGAREGYVEDYLVRQCGKRGFLCYKFTSPSNDGVPDRIVIGHGSTVFVEVKAPGEKARKLQLAVHRRMRSFGADVRVVDTRDGVDAMLDELEAKDTNETQPKDKKEE